MGDTLDHAHFCIHFARGCCSLGHTCKFLHHVPNLKECSKIDQSVDIFGRTRHAKFRDDMQGLGSFMKETRTLCVSEFIQPIGENVSAVVYEMLWRYFSAFGEIEVMI